MYDISVIFRCIQICLYEILLQNNLQGLGETCHFHPVMATAPVYCNNQNGGDLMIKFSK